MLDKVNWTLISGTFTSLGTERFITIGNFYNDASTAIYLNVMSQAVSMGFYAMVNDEVLTVEGEYVGSPRTAVPAEYERELPLAPFAGALVAHLNLLLCAGRLPPDVQRLMIDALNATPLPASPSPSARRDRVAAAVMMVLACPEYLVHH